jgi:hypothetical protein
MPDLKQSLLNHDLGHLRIVAEAWGVELAAPETREALTELRDSLLERELVAEIFESLPELVRAALAALQQKDGRIPWAQFIRSYGEIREIGPGRRDRERPDRNPVSAAETLWYHALIARAFFDTSSGPQEFAYIPDDLLPLLPPAPEKETQPGILEEQPLLGRTATPKERAHFLLAEDSILDHICTLLAAARLSLPAPLLPGTPAPLLPFTQTLLTTANLLAPGGLLPDPEAARVHLEASRSEAMLQLVQAWLNSETHNDLHLLPNLQPEGEWSNDPLKTRQFMIGLLQIIPEKTWWSISAFVADIRRDYPDFQRPAGDYDSWFLRDTRTDEYLRGFEHWDSVDGALIRYLISGPLHWLGVMDLAVPGEDSEPEMATAFRLSRWGVDLLNGIAPKGFPREQDQLHVRSDGRIGIPSQAPRAVRYQVARFCHWGEAKAHEYRYRMTPASLEKALDQGLQIKHLQTLLARHAGHVPPNIVTALQRWDRRGTEIRFQNALILRVGSPKILEALRGSRAARFLGDPLGPTTVIIKAGAGGKVMEALTEMGYLGEWLDLV